MSMFLYENIITININGTKKDIGESVICGQKVEYRFCYFVFLCL